jgi:hypothetical protein
VAVQANILIRGPVSPLRVVCELRDLDTGRVSGVTKVIGMDAATIAPTCWIRGAPVAGHRYQVTMSLWRVGASEPLAAGSRTFVGGNGR